MSNKQIAALVILVAVYYYWSWRKRSGKLINVNTGRFVGVKPSFSANTFGVGANTTPTSQSLSTGPTNAAAGRGTGFFLAPVKNIAQLNMPTRSAGVGARGPNYWISRSAKGFGTGGISPTWPTTQVLPTKSVKISNGSVQVPYYAAVPTTVRGLGGAGSVLFGGRS